MNLIKLILLALLCGLCMLASARLIRKARADLAFKTAKSFDGVLRASRLDPENPVYFRAIGDHWLTVFPPRLHLASDAYRTAAILNPYSALYWVDWAQASARQRRPDEARRLLAMADFVNPFNSLIQLHMGNISMELGDQAQSVNYHARSIARRPALADNLCALYRGLGMTPREISSKLLSPNVGLVRSFFLVNLNAIEPDEAKRYWLHLCSLPGAADATARQAYFNYLISKKQYADARELWREISREYYGVPWDEVHSLFWNGNLDLPRRFAGGLEWQFPKPQPEGCTVEITSPEGPSTGPALVMKFDGTKNLQGVLARHALFVRPGVSYVLRCQTQVTDITTDNGPYLVLTIQGGDSRAVKSQVLTGNGAGEISLKFSVPAGCEWAEMAIRRDLCQRLNNRIGGEVRFFRFRLEPVTAGKEGVS